MLLWIPIAKKQSKLRPHVVQTELDPKRSNADEMKQAGCRASCTSWIWKELAISKTTMRSSKDTNQGKIAGMKSQVANLHLDLAEFGQEWTELVAQGDPRCSQLMPAFAFTNLPVQRAFLQNSSLGDAMALHLGKAVARGCFHLCTLVLHNHGISAKGVRWLVTGLRLHAALNTLDLSHNLCGDAGAEALAVLLGESAALHTLRLRDNGVGADGAAKLAAGLLSMRKQARTLRGRAAASLQVLDLAMNGIGDEGATALAIALGQNRSLLALDISACCVTVCGAGALVAALERNRTLRSLCVWSLVFGKGDAAALAGLRRRVAVGPTATL